MHEQLQQFINRDCEVITIGNSHMIFTGNIIFVDKNYITLQTESDIIMIRTCFIKAIRIAGERY